MNEKLTMPAGVINRRSFIFTGALGAAAASGLLSGCGGGGSPTPATSGGSSAPVGGSLNFLTYQGYDGKGVAEDWYKENGIELKPKYLSNENIPQFIAGPGGAQFDLFSENQGNVALDAKLGVTSPITVDEVPSISDFYPLFRDGDFWKNSNGTYDAIPWSWGPIGITYNPKKVQPEAIQSWQDLLSTEWRGKLGTFDSALNMVAIAAMASGVDPAKVTVDDLNGPIKEYLTELKPQLKVLSTSVGDQVNTMVAGDVVMQLVGYPGLNAQGAEAGVPLKFTYPPKEGTFGFADSLCIPPRAPNRQNALAWINMVTTPNAWSGKLQEFNIEASPNPAINETLGTAVTSVFPPNLEEFVSDKLTFNRSYADSASGFATNDEVEKLWQNVKALG